MLENAASVDGALSALAARLEAMDADKIDVVVIGGAALSVLGFIDRSTRDVDVVAIGIREAGSDVPVLIKSRPLPPALKAAAEGVGRDLGLISGWLNAGPADLLDHGLPAGFVARLLTKRYGTRLVAHFPARVDLIAFKVYAAADTGIGRHTQDLTALSATPSELFVGAQWARSQDPSEGFKSMLVAMLEYCGATREAEELANDS